MTAHELARKLLEGPDLTVELFDEDGFWDNRPQIFVASSDCCDPGERGERGYPTVLKITGTSGN